MAVAGWMLSDDLFGKADGIAPQDLASATATSTTTASAVDRVDYVVLDSSNIHAVATLNLS